MKIRLSQNSILGPTVHRFVMVLISLLLLAQSLLHIASRPIQYDVLFFLDLAILLGGIWFLLLGLFCLSSGSKYVLRVEIDDTTVLIHNHTFGRTYNIDLNNIAKIIFGSFELTFVGYDGNYQTYRINTRKSSESQKIKEELRRIAAPLSIMIDDEIAAMIRKNIRSQK